MIRVRNFLICTLMFLLLLGCKMDDTSDSIKGSVMFRVVDTETESNLHDVDIILISGDEVIGKVKTKEDGRTVPVKVEAQFDDRFAIIRKQLLEGGIHVGQRHGVIQAIALKEGYFPVVLFDIIIYEQEGSVSGRAFTMNPYPIGEAVHPFADNKIEIDTPSNFMAGSLIDEVINKIDEIEEITE